MKFEAFDLRSELVAALRNQGLVKATPIQEKSIPVLMSGQDVVAEAQTGTGKTLAFVLPILERARQDKQETQALIVTPTRELAIQITEEVRKLAPVVGLQVLAAYGGQDVEAQIRKLQGAPQIIVATPGRLLDHMRRGTAQLYRVRMLVLDEADQMLHMGFLPEVQQIIDQLPKDRQTMMFSATMSDSVRKLAAKYAKQPVDIRVRGTHITLDDIEQFAVETTDRGKLGTLIAMLHRYRPYLAVIFCRTKIRAKKLAESLLEEGLNVGELHGDLTQAKREQVMKRFRNADLQFLVATDVAARGLDVEGVTHVINYDIPADAESYIHRIGRTGRAGQQGMAITFASAKDRRELADIEKGIGTVLTRRPMTDFVEQADLNQREELRREEGRVKKASTKNQRNNTISTSKSSRNKTSNDVSRNRSGKGQSSTDGKGKPKGKSPRYAKK